MAKIEDKRAVGGAAVRGASPEQLREAERGLRVMLSGRYPRGWIDQNIADLLSDATVEYAQWLESNSPHRSPAGWLAQRAWWRALDLARQEGRQDEPLGAVIRTTADPEGTTEDVALANDRGRRIAKALSRISPKDRRLVELVHVEGHTVTEAARLLGWGRATATEHLSATLDKLEALIGPRDQIADASLAFLFGLAAEQTLTSDPDQRVGGFLRRLSSIAQDLSELVSRSFHGPARRLGEALRRAVPFADPGFGVSSAAAARAAAQTGALLIAVVGSAALLSTVDPSSDLPTLGHPEPPGGAVQRSAATRVATPIGAVRSASPPRLFGPENGSYRAAVQRRVELRRAAELKRARERRIAAKRRVRRARRNRRRVAERRRRAEAEQRRTAIEEARPEEVTESSEVAESPEPSEEAPAPEEAAPAPAETEQTEANPGQVQETFNPFTRP